MRAGRLRFLDAKGAERGLVEVHAEGGVVTLMSQRDGEVHRLHVSADAAERISNYLDAAAAAARAAPHEVPARPVNSNGEHE